MKLDQLKQMLLKPGCKACNLDLARELLYGNKNRTRLQDPQPQQTVCQDSLGEEGRAKESAPCVIVRIISHRHDLLDPDNLCPKYVIDGLRYAGLVADDTEDKIEVSIQQVQCAKALERTEIILTLPD